MKVIIKVFSILSILLGSYLVFMSLWRWIKYFEVRDKFPADMTERMLWLNAFVDLPLLQGAAGLIAVTVGLTTLYLLRNK